MPHQLLIVPHLITEPRFREFLSYFETVTSEPMTIELHITNIGEKTFPGGVISGGLRFQTPLGMGIYEQRRRANPSRIPNILPHGTFVTKCDWLPMAPGLWEFALKVETTDKEAIAYYQGEGENPVQRDHWVQFLYAVDHRQLESIMLLKELLKKG
jgi:hypothetical protein